MTIYNDYRLQQQIDNITSSGTGGSGDVTQEMLTTTSGDIIAQFTSEPCFSDIITWSGSVDASQGFPASLFTLPANCYIEEVNITVSSGFRGGYGEQVGITTPGTKDDPGSYSYIDRSYALTNGRTVMQMSHAGGAASYNYKIAHEDSPTQFDVTTVVSTFSKSTGADWKALSNPYLVPDTGTYRPGYWTDNAINHAENGGSMPYRSGDASGNNQTFTAWGYTGVTATRYEKLYYIGAEATEDITTSFGLAGESEPNYSYGNGASLAKPYSRNIKLYGDETGSVDTSGLVGIEIKYRQVCYEGTTFTGTGGIAVTEVSGTYTVDGSDISLDCAECTPSGLVVDNAITAPSGIFTAGIQVGSGTVYVLPDGFKLTDGTLVATSEDLGVSDFAEISARIDTSLVFNPYGSQNSSTDDVTDNMTSNTEPAPNVVSATHGSADAWRLFDRVLGNLSVWNVPDAPSRFPISVMFDFGSGNSKIVNKYAFWAASVSTIDYTPRDWKFQGSNSASAAVGDAEEANGWITLDTQEDFGGVANYEWSDYFTFHNDTDYQKYRFRFTDCNDWYRIILRGIKLVEAENSLLSPNIVFLEPDTNTSASGALVRLDTEVNNKLTTTSGDLASSIPTDATGLSIDLSDVPIADGSTNTSTAYATPDMMCNTLPAPYQVSASSSWDSTTYAPWKAFDRSTDVWHSADGSPPPQWLQVDLGPTNTKAINKYRLRARNISSNRSFPADWQIQGSQDGSNWDTLDTRSSVSDPGQSQWSAYFTFNNDTKYRYYRIYVTASNPNTSNVCIAELHLIEAQNGSPTSILNASSHSNVKDAVVALDGAITTTSGDIVAQIPSDYVTSSQLTTTSGDIINYVDTEIATVSGGGGVSDHGALTGLTDNDHPQYNYGYKADVRLEYTDSNTITLTGVDGTSKNCRVNEDDVDCSSDSTIDTDSASHFIITGTTTVAKSTALDSYTGNGSDGNAYNAYGLFHVYLANNDAAFNFASYDRRNEIFLSPNAPTGGYLAASGDGANARYMGSICCNSSRQFDNVLCVWSNFNVIPASVDQDCTDSGDTSLTLTSEVIPTNCSAYAIVPPGVVVSVSIKTFVKNDDTDGCEFFNRIKYGSTVKNYVRAYLRDELAGLNYFQAVSASYSGTEDTLAVKQISLAIYTSGANSTPEYIGDYTGINICRGK